MLVAVGARIWYSLAEQTVRAAQTLSDVAVAAWDSYSVAEHTFSEAHARSVERLGG